MEISKTRISHAILVVTFEEDPESPASLLLSSSFNLPVKNSGERFVVIGEEDDEIHHISRERMNSASRNRRFRGFLRDGSFEFGDHRIDRFAEVGERIGGFGSRIVAEDLFDLGKKTRDRLVNVESREDLLDGFSAFRDTHGEDEESQSTVKRDLGEARLGDGDGNLNALVLVARRYHTISDQFQISHDICIFRFRSVGVNRDFLPRVKRFRRSNRDGFRIEISSIRFQNSIELLLQVFHRDGDKAMRSSELM
ncbi:unnamed protein product [Thlaspi arvense]|uniref:Uncharacterized protein n=1 Tax=Thlaspi arvense TaxID=13288 RepID=A0AAU9S8J9_THLAR|nr:unnamed protein product [Thlaspi arvense]